MLVANKHLAAKPTSATGRDGESSLSPWLRSLVIELP